MGYVAIFLVGCVFLATWLMVKSQENYDTNKEDEDDEGDPPMFI